MNRPWVWPWVWTTEIQGKVTGVDPRKWCFVVYLYGC